MHAAIDGFWFILLPIVAASLLWIFVKLPPNMRDFAYKTVVISLLLAIVYLQWQVWGAISVLPETMAQKQQDTQKAIRQDEWDFARRIFGI